MKNSISRIGTIFGVAIGCSLLTAGALEAKPDKGNGGGNGNGKGKGGSPGHSEKGKGGGKEKKSKGNNESPKKDKDHDERKHFEKALVNPGKAQKDFKKEAENVRKEVENHERVVTTYRENRFRDDDRSGVIRYFDEYRDNDLGLPPGLAKNYRQGKPLPPGWQKKVSDGYVIEEDWNQYFHPLEDDIFPFMERVPDTRLYWYGDRVVRVYEPRREVIDVIQIPSIRFDGPNAVAPY